MFETLIVTDNIKELIVNDESTLKIRDEAIKEGYKPLLVDGIYKVVNGITTLQEINNQLLFY